MAIQSDLYPHQNAAGRTNALWRGDNRAPDFRVEPRLVTAHVRSSDITDFTIFLIDDDPCMLKALVTLLQTEGHRTKPYSSSAQFLNRRSFYFLAERQCPLLALSGHRLVRRTCLLSG